MRFRIDLKKLEGDGSFPCPNCGAIISPEDESNKVYIIQETYFEDGELTRLVLKCRCGAKIELIL